jgi:hypothetical protein
MTAEKFFKQENKIKPFNKSCFYGVKGIEYHDSRIDNDIVFSKEQVIAFAKAYNKQLKTK